MAVSKKAFVLGGLGVFVGLFIIGSLIDDDSASVPPNPALMEDAADVGASTTGGEVTLSPDAVKCAIDHVGSYRWSVQSAYAMAEAGQSSTVKDKLEAPRVALTVQIPADQLVYWYPTGAEASPVCTRDQRGQPTAAYFEMLDNPFAAVDAAAKGAMALDATFVPSKKGEFEKTTEYEARIAQERQAFEASHSGSGNSAAALAEAWISIMGRPWIITINNKSYTYDPDREVLTLHLVSIQDIPDRNGIPPKPVFDVPVEVAIPRDAAKKYSDALGGIHPSGLEVTAVAMQLENGSLAVREISINPVQGEYSSDPGPRQKAAMDAAGISLSHLEMSYKIPYRFGS